MAIPAPVRLAFATVLLAAGACSADDASSRASPGPRPPTGPAVAPKALGAAAIDCTDPPAGGPFSRICMSCARFDPPIEFYRRGKRLASGTGVVVDTTYADPRRLSEDLSRNSGPVLLIEDAAADDGEPVGSGVVRWTFHTPDQLGAAAPLRYGYPYELDHSVTVSGAIDLGVAYRGCRFD